MGEALDSNYDNLMVEPEREHHGDFTNYLRMYPAMFHELLLRMTPRLEKKDSKWQKALQPGLKLAITFRFLASGDTYHSLSYAFRVPHNTISLFMTDVLQAIVDKYDDEVVSLPSTPDEWRELSEKFGTQ